MLDRAHLLAWRSGASTDEELADAFGIAAHAGSDLLGLGRSSLLPGAPADLMAVDAANVAQTVVDRPAPAWVLRAGHVVARDGVFTALDLPASS
jgi:cytosine/adenosine deaminase-related metal-dependent hydrolase